MKKCTALEAAKRLEDLQSFESSCSDRNYYSES